MINELATGLHIPLIRNVSAATRAENAPWRCATWGGGAKGVVSRLHCPHNLWSYVGSAILLVQKHMPLKMTWRINGLEPLQQAEINIMTRINCVHSQSHRPLFNTDWPKWLQLAIFFVTLAKVWSIDWWRQEKKAAAIDKFVEREVRYRHRGKT